MLNQPSRSTVRRHARSLRVLATSTLFLGLFGAGALGHAQTPAGGAHSGPPPAVVLTASGDPVLVQLGSTREHASFVLERFEIAVRGVASNQGLAYDTVLFDQLYGFLPTFLQQRATELVLIAQAAARGIVVEEGHVDAVVDRLRSSLGRDADAYALALEQAGFRSEDQLRTMVLESELVRRAADAIRASFEVTPEQLVVAYHAERARFTSDAQACARHVLVREHDQAVALFGRLGAGEAFADVARTESLDAGSAVRGGELGCIRPGTTVAAFDRALFSASGPGLIGPVQTQYGYHVIEVYDLRPARVQPFEEVRAQLETELREALGEAALAAIIGMSGVRTFPEHIPPLEGHVEPSEGIDPAAGI